jgi:ATP-dependent DNA helicase RecG
VGKSTIEDFVNKLRNHTDPVLYPSVNVKTFGLGEIVSIQIPESDQKPVFAFDRAYIRVGKTNIKLNAAEVRKMIKAYTLPDYDEAVMNINHELIELDTDMILSLNKEYFKFKGLSSSDEILNRLDVIKEGKLTNAGYLCFAKKVHYIPAASIKAARFKGNSMSTFIDMKNFDSNLISAVDDILEFISRHINMKVIINGDAHRKEIWDYPIAALREAVINAVVHRDYSDPGNIQVRIFDDIIEVWSPGRLPKEIDISKLLIENRSIPRNRNLARIFFQVGLIENWGTGFHRMTEACHKNGNPLPLFEEKAGAFVITFKIRNPNEE